jgi:hypothetical protein
MIATTIINSISENPFCVFVFIGNPGCRRQRHKDANRQSGLQTRLQAHRLPVPSSPSSPLWPLYPSDASRD